MVGVEGGLTPEPGVHGVGSGFPATQEVVAGGVPHRVAVELDATAGVAPDPAARGAIGVGGVVEGQHGGGRLVGGSGGR